MRDGYDRLVSEYYFTNPDHSFEQFLSGLQTWQKNPQTKFLAGFHPVVHEDEIEMLERALDNMMDRFWLVTPTDMNAILLALLARRFQWSRIDRTPQNVTRDMFRMKENSVLRARTRPFYFADQMLFNIVAMAWEIISPTLPPSLFGTSSDSA